MHGQASRLFRNLTSSSELPVSWKALYKSTCTPRDWHWMKRPESWHTAWKVLGRMLYRAESRQKNSAFSWRDKLLETHPLLYSSGHSLFTRQIVTLIWSPWDSSFTPVADGLLLCLGDKELHHHFCIAVIWHADRGKNGISSSCLAYANT